MDYLIKKLSDKIELLEIRIDGLEAENKALRKENTELKNSQVKLQKIVDVIANQPSSVPPTKTDSMFSKQETFTFLSPGDPNLVPRLISRLGGSVDCRLCRRRSFRGILFGG